MNTDDLIQNQPKVIRYDWKVKDEPGIFKFIDKNLLSIDHRYQRKGIKNSRVLEFSRNWSWIACNCLSIIYRHEQYWIIDGQHRKLAADKRTDIESLPCMIYKCDDNIEKEAEAFLTINTRRISMHPYDKFRALLIKKDDVAIKVNILLETSNHYPAKHGSSRGVGCLKVIMDSMRRNEDITKRLWPLCVDIHKDDPIHSYIWEGLFYIEYYIRNTDQSLLNPDEYNKLVMAGKFKILDYINKAKIYFTKGGASIYAAGILNLINFKRKKNIIKIKSS